MYNEKNPACIYCRNNATKYFLKSRNFNYFKCESCQLVFLYPRPNIKRALPLNKEMYGKRNKISEYFRREKYYRQVSKMILKEIKKYQRCGRLLDVGSAFGLFLDEARKANFDVSGVEIEKEAANYAKKRFKLKIINDNFENLDISQYNVITYVDVLEHFNNLKNVLVKTNKMLNRNGVLFIQCPNINSLVFRLAKEKWNWLLPDVHLYQFSIKSLKKLLEENGFNVLSTRTYDDISEFAYNVIDVLGIKKIPLRRAVAKAAMARRRQGFAGQRILWKSLRIIFLMILQLSFIWDHVGYGGIINIVARKKNIV